MYKLLILILAISAVASFNKHRVQKLRFMNHQEDIAGVDDSCLQDEIQSCVTDYSLLPDLQKNDKQMREDLAGESPTYDNLKAEVAKFEDDEKTGAVWTCVSEKLDKCKEDEFVAFHKEDIEGVDDQCLQNEIQSCVTDQSLIPDLQENSQQMREDLAGESPTYDNLKAEVAKFEDDEKTGAVWTCVSEKLDQCKEDQFVAFHKQSVDGVDDECFSKEMQSCAGPDSDFEKLKEQSDQIDEDLGDSLTYENVKDELSKFEDDEDTGAVWTCVSEKLDQCKEDEFVAFHKQSVDGVDDECFSKEMQSCVGPDSDFQKLEEQSQELDEELGDTPSYEEAKDKLAELEEDSDTGSVWTCVSDKLDQCKEE